MDPQVVLVLTWLVAGLGRVGVHTGSWCGATASSAGRKPPKPPRTRRCPTRSRGPWHGWSAVPHSPNVRRPADETDAGCPFDRDPAAATGATTTAPAAASSTELRRDGRRPAVRDLVAARSRAAHDHDRTVGDRRSCRVLDRPRPPSRSSVPRSPTSSSGCATTSRRSTRSHSRRSAATTTHGRDPSRWAPPQSSRVAWRSRRCPNGRW